VIPDADETIARVEDQLRVTEDRAARMPAFQAEIDAIRGAATSRARDVRVEVDANGRVTALELTEQALTGGARRLSREILATIAAAEIQAKEQAVRSVGTLLGQDDPITLQLQADVEARQAGAAAKGRKKSEMGAHR
jgi:DNA-binding protein YbaB